MLLELLEPFRAEFDISGENAGLHLLLTSKRKVTEKVLLEAASRQGIKVYGLSDSLVKKEDQNQSHTVILGYG